MAEVEYGKITDEGLAKIRARIGAGFENRRPWRTEVTRDAIYHLALAIGDLSPMYLDEEYAKKTRWGTLLAPPIMINSFDTLRAVGSAGLPEGLPGVHSIWSGSMYEFEQPLQARRRRALEVVPEGSARGGEQLRRRARRLPDLRGGVLEPEGREARHAPGHLDPQRAPQDQEDRQVRRDRARQVDARTDPRAVEDYEAEERAADAQVGRREGRRRAASRSSRAR